MCNYVDERSWLLGRRRSPSRWRSCRRNCESEKSSRQDHEKRQQPAPASKTQESAIAQPCVHERINVMPNGVVRTFHAVLRWATCPSRKTVVFGMLVVHERANVNCPRATRVDRCSTEDTSPHCVAGMPVLLNVSLDVLGWLNGTADYLHTGFAERSQLDAYSRRFRSKLAFGTLVHGCNLGHPFRS